MEEDTLQQQLQIVKYSFPLGCKVFNYKVGSIGNVTGNPFTDSKSQKIFLPVNYFDQECLEDIENIGKVNTVKKSSRLYS